MSAISAREVLDLWSTLHLPHEKVALSLSGSYNEDLEEWSAPNVLFWLTTLIKMEASGQLLTQTLSKPSIREKWRASETGIGMYALDGGGDVACRISVPSAFWCPEEVRDDTYAVETSEKVVGVAKQIAEWIQKGMPFLRQFQDHTEDTILLNTQALARGKGKRGQSSSSHTDAEGGVDEVSRDNSPPRAGQTQPIKQPVVINYQHHAPSDRSSETHAFASDPAQAPGYTGGDLGEGSSLGASAGVPAAVQGMISFSGRPAESAVTSKRQASGGYTDRGTGLRSDGGTNIGGAQEVGQGPGPVAGGSRNSPPPPPDLFMDGYNDDSALGSPWDATPTPVTSQQRLVASNMTLDTRRDPNPRAWTYRSPSPARPGKKQQPVQKPSSTDTTVATSSPGIVSETPRSGCSNCVKAKTRCQPASVAPTSPTAVGHKRKRIYKGVRACVRCQQQKARCDLTDVN